MTDSTEPGPLPLEDALNECFRIRRLTDVQLAFCCIERLLAQRRSENEADAEFCDGIETILRFVKESLSRRDDAAYAALRGLSRALLVERNQGTV
jgi:hypothetical protein